MSEQIEARGTCRDEYQLVGREIFPGEVALSLEDAKELYYHAIGEFFMVTPSKVRDLPPDGDKTVYCGNFCDETSELDFITTPNYFFGAILKQISDERWRLRCMKTKSHRTEWDGLPYRTVASYAVEVDGGQVTEATKCVSIIRGVGELDLLQGGIPEPSSEEIAKVRAELDKPKPEPEHKDEDEPEELSFGLLTSDEDNPEVTIERKKFERLMTPADCDTLRTVMNRLVSELG